MTTKSMQEVHEALSVEEVPKTEHYGVRITSAESFIGIGYQVDILQSFGWPEETCVESAYITAQVDYPFGTDMALYRILDRFNHQFLDTMEEDLYVSDPHVFTTSGSFYQDNENPDSWLNDVELIKL